MFKKNRIKRSDKVVKQQVSIKKNEKNKNERTGKVNKRKKSKTSPGSMEFFFDTTLNQHENQEISYGIQHSTIEEKKLERREKMLAASLFGDVNLSLPKGKAKRKKAKADVAMETVLNDSGLDASINEPERKPVWVDDDDDNIRVKHAVATFTKARGKRGERETSNAKYESTLREKFTQVMGGTPQWAQLDKKIDIDSDEEEFNRKTGNYLSSEAPADLPKTVLEFKKLYDLNRTTYAEGGVIKAVDFNPNFEVALVGGFHKNLGCVSLFQADGCNNHHIQTVKFPHYPIKCAKFLGDGRKFVVRSNYFNHFFTYDMESGKETRVPLFGRKQRGTSKAFFISPDGQQLIFLSETSEIYIYDTQTFSHIDTLHCPTPVEDATFNSDGSKMYCCGYGGDVLIWDMRNRVCIDKFYDDGCTEGTSIVLSPNDQYLACGSHSGIVNIYDTASLTTDTPKPVKSLSKLLTRVTSLAFNPTSEILATISEPKEDAIKLVHFPSMTYFQNFPAPSTKLSRIQLATFSPKGGYLSVANNRGSAQLYRLKYFSSY